MTQELSVAQLTYVESRLANERKSAGLSYLLWFFLGALGGHNFYLGRTTIAVIQLILTILGIITSFIGIGFLFLGIVGLWALVDAFLIPGVIREDLERKRQALITHIAMGTAAPAQ